jgi:hypothetical protein
MAANRSRRGPDRPTIPTPRLEKVWNLTPFAMFRCDKMGPGRVFHDTVALKGTFGLAPGMLQLAEIQRPLEVVDSTWDTSAPERSSLRRAGEVVLGKPATDVIVTGSVHAPDGRPQSSWNVGVALRGPSGLALDSVARVTGPRAWEHRRLRGWVLSEPEATSAVPIRYELAWGGSYFDVDAAQRGDDDPWVVHPDNPSGRGFCDARAMDREASHPAPQWEDPASPIRGVNEEVPVAGFGPIMRPWRSRLRYSGTYDETWMRETRAAIEAGIPPDYARDFDPRFFQCAHPSLIAPQHLCGGEEISLLHALPEHRLLTFTLPRVRLVAALRSGGWSWHAQELALDTVHVDLDDRTVGVVWRLTLDQARDVGTAVIKVLEDP